MDQQDTTTDDHAAAAWPELSADVSHARTAARTITLDTLRASSDGRILEITAQLDQMRTRLSSLEESLFEVKKPDATSDDLLVRLSALDTEIAHTASQFESLASRVAAAEENVSTTMVMSLDGFDSRVALVEDARTTQANELNQLTSYLEQAFLRITELAEALEEEQFSNRAAHGELSVQSSQLAEDVNARMENVQDTVASLTERLGGAASSIDASTNEVQDAIVASLAQLESRLDASENRLGHLDEVSTAMKFLASRTEALETQQHEIGTDQPTRAEVEELSERVTVTARDTAASLEIAERHRAEIIDNVDHAHNRIDAAHNEIRELRTKIDQPAVSETVEAELGSLRSTLSKVVDTQQASMVTNAINRDDEESTRAAVEDALTASAHAHQLASDVSDRIGNIAETTELIGQRVDVVQGATEDLNHRFETVRTAAETSLNQARGLDEAVGGLSARLDNAATALDAAHSRLDETEATAQSAHARIDETQTTAQSAHARIDETQTATTTRLDHVEATAQSAHPRIDEVAAVAQSAHARIDETTQSLNGLITDASRALDERLDESLGHVDERLDDTVRTVNERLEVTVQHLTGRIDESANAQPAVDPTMINSMRTMGERTKSLESHVDEIDQRFTTLDENLSEVDQRFTTLDENLSEVDQRFTTLDENLSEVDQRVHIVSEETSSIAERSEQISDRLDHTTASVEQAANATAEMTVRVEATEGRISAAEERISHTKQRLEENLASTAETASRALEVTGELERKITASVNERSTALREHLLGRIEEARAQLQQALDESNASTSDARTSLRETVLDRLDAIEHSVECRMSAIEQNSNDDDRLESIESRIEQTDKTASEAYAYADSLRLLQTDIVQALQDELRLHDDRLDQFDGHLETIQAASKEHASAERVHMLEAKLVEALQTVSQLTQLQRRNTTIEAQLTDTLTATSHGVESTQMSVATLRGDLEAAHTRITQLELRLSAPAVATGLPTVEDPSEPSVFELTEDDLYTSPTAAMAEDKADTGWFTESYARRSQEPKAS